MILQTRPRRLRRLVAGTASVLVLAGAGIGWAGQAQAVPGQCGGGYALGHGGEFCDSAAWPDGSFWHQERVCVFGICGSNGFRACHVDNGPGVPAGRVPTDNDPGTPC